MMELKVIYEDNDIIGVIKPPKVPSQPDKTGDMDILTAVEQYLKKNEEKGNQFVGLVHRLDRPVGGVMVFTKNKVSNSKLSEMVRTKQIKKQYYAVVCGTPDKDKGVLRDYLIKNEKNNLSIVVNKDTKNSKEAVLDYELICKTIDDKYGILSLVKINLFTGRHHQIRVQFANYGNPLWGDNKYNEIFIKQKAWTQIALWSGVLEFKHPINRKGILLEEKPEGYPFDLFDYGVLK